MSSVPDLTKIFHQLDGMLPVVRGSVKSRTLFIPACWSLYYILYQQAVTHARSASEDSFSTVISSIFQYYYVLSVSISHDCTAALQTLSSLAKYTPTCSHLIFSLVLRTSSAWSEIGFLFLGLGKVSSSLVAILGGLALYQGS